MRPKYGLVPHLVVNGAAKAIEFYKAAMGAVEVTRVPHENDTRLIHATLMFGPSPMFLCDDFPEFCGGVSRAPKPGAPTSVTLHLDVPNCDAAVAKAVAAGATVAMPPTDMFWGDRYAKITDPFGHEWSFTHPLQQGN